MKSNSFNKYRKNVLGVFIKKQCKCMLDDDITPKYLCSKTCKTKLPPLVLVGKRSDFLQWQFPQGGVDNGESLEQALRREMKEELSIQSFDIITSNPDPLVYDFPKNYKDINNYTGQEQYWFLCQLSDNNTPDLNNAIDKEFIEIKWVNPSYILNEVVYFKKDVYRKGLEYFNLL
ncbi:RNA pyrophosphohydrolase [Astathelohania contejeani]|uniref:RNA pyrophosphohydrolase n=1 Tax=Astathelohania contejeani TaxID=164912 RepID=A0ABQ7HVA8_9MICR|nr:RNA pyrophosphohydrolase [Thelohania contejeani]